MNKKQFFEESGEWRLRYAKIENRTTTKRNLETVKHALEFPERVAFDLPVPDVIAEMEMNSENASSMVELLHVQNRGSGFVWEN